MRSKSPGASTMRNSCRSGHSATMSRTFSLLSLILFTIGFTPDQGSTAPEAIRVDTGLLFQNPEYQKELETEGFEEAQRRLFHEDESPSELVGNWRDNGEALEPKWRDGDTVPLLPFSEYSRYSRDQLANLEQVSDRRRDHRPRGPSRIPHPEHYEWLDDRFDYSERDQAFHQRRNNKGNFYRQSSVFLDKERDASESDLKDIRSPRYREAFQARPNDYGQELDDEEYLKPRPRKRRPPQNYEFALAANEASLREKKAENRKMQSRMNARNAAELKSLLKMQQEEGLSLSELLQRRNLTLNDLLGGKEEVISALKAKDEEFDDYVDRVEKVMTNSFARIFTTPNPVWGTTLQQELEVAREKGEHIPKISTTAKSTRQMSTDVPRKMSAESESISVSTEISTRKHGNMFTTVEPVVVSTSDENTSTLTSSTSATTPNASPMTLSVDKASENETSKSRNREVKFDEFDEDEIMEFSDLPDFQKGRQGGSPMWIAMQDEPRTESSGKTNKNTSSDSASTLSIEQVLHPTQHTKSRGDPSVQGLKELESDVTIIKLEKPWAEDEPIPIHKNIDQDKMMENDYQDDGSMISHGSVYTTQTNIDDAEHNEQTIMMENIHPIDLPQYKQQHGKPENHNTDGKDRYEDIMSETESEARAEIFELFASSSAAKRLERLLKSRNMSIDELIALRQRGSSKIHLAEASRLRAQKSNTGIETNARDNINNTMPPKYQEPDESIRHVNKEIEKILQKSSIEKTNSETVLESEGDQQTRDITNSPLNGEVNMLNENETLNGLKQNVPRRMYEIVDLLTTFASLPFAKDIQRELDPAFSENEEETEKKLSITSTDTNDSFLSNSATPTPSTSSPELVESKYIEEIVKQEPNTINIRTMFRETDTLAEKETNRVEEKKNLSRVKPSIIASAAILGVTTVVFLTIFIICRVRQKQKYRYRNTFSRAVFQGPMMAARKLSNSSSLSNVMVNVVATSTTKRPERNEIPDNTLETDPRSDIDSDSLDATDSWETIPDYMK